MQPESYIPKLYADLQDAISPIVVGATEPLRLLLTACLCGGHVLLEDLPGTGKTTLVQAVAQCLGCSCRRVQGTPDLMPADLTGFQMLQRQSDGSGQMVFRKGPVFTNLLFVDEINRMAPRTQAGLLECMAERQMTCDGVTYPLPQPFVVIATQNPIELQGTFPLPEAELDRFFMRLTMPHLTRTEELQILQSRSTATPLAGLRAVTTPEALLTAQAAVWQVWSEPTVLHYLMDLVEATRRHAEVQFGVSTRGALALRQAAQAYAAVDGRSYLVPDDVKAVFVPVCAHRLRLTGRSFADAYSDTQAAERLLATLLDTIEVPK